MNMLLGFTGLGTTELMIVAGIFILLFGSTKLPGLARSIGKSANEFKKGIRDDSPLDEDEDEAEDEDEDKDEDDGADEFKKGIRDDSPLNDEDDGNDQDSNGDGDGDNGDK